MVKNILVRKITSEENERINDLKKILKVNTAAGVVRVLLKRGRI